MSMTWSAAPNHALIVLDHQHRVADVGELAQRPDEPVVVAAMQADGRLIEHVAHADKARANLRGEPDAQASPPESVAAVRSSVR